MRKFIALAILCAVIFQSCRKENSAISNPQDRTQASIEIDGETLNITYSADNVNQCETYSFVGSAGYYYGVSSLFKMSDKENLQIIFGTLRTDSSSLDEEAFLQLIKAGERSFGSLGAFTSYPALAPDKVEIAFVDKKSQRWCSTEITEFNADNGIHTTINIHQPEGKFVIEEVERVFAEDIEAYRIKGNFKCFVYEVNGKRKKKMNGKFVGVVRIN